MFLPAACRNARGPPILGQAWFGPSSFHKGLKSGTITIIDSGSSKPQVIELSGTGT
jgi:hypothetical protein